MGDVGGVVSVVVGVSFGDGSVVFGVLIVVGIESNCTTFGTGGGSVVDARFLI